MNTPLTPLSPPVADAPLRSPLPGLPALPADGTPLGVASLHQLLRAALPDKSSHKAQGWFGDTDFLLTRTHVDEDGDTYHDGLFLTVWQQWDFWIADAPPPTHASVLRAVAAHASGWLLRRPAARGGFTLLYRRHGADSGGDAHWRPLPDGPGAAGDESAALAACQQAWQGLLGYWRKALTQRQLRYPLRDRLLSEWTAERIELLALLPRFAQQPQGGRWASLQGQWQGPLWIGTRPPQPPAVPGLRRHGPQEGAALRLGWRTSGGTASRGDPTDTCDSDDGDHDESVACYQLEVIAGREPAHAGSGTRLRITYAQRWTDAREPLPPEAIDHTEHLLQLLAQAEAHLQRIHAPSAGDDGMDDTASADAAAWPPALQWLAHDHPLPSPEEEDAHLAPAPPHAPWLALSHAWQAAGRSRAARHRRGLPAGADPRTLHAARVLALARLIGSAGDGTDDMAISFHRRFAYAPGCYAEQAATLARRVGPVVWLPDAGALVAAGVAAAAGTADLQWVGFDLQGTARRMPLSPAQIEAAAAIAAEARGAAPEDDADGAVRASGPGWTVSGDAHGMLQAHDEAAGRPLWQHRVATTAITGLAVSPDGRTVVAGTAGGELAVLRKSGGPDPFAEGDSRYVEVVRWLFWNGEAEAGIRW